jgi:hypothetical protein
MLERTWRGLKSLLTRPMPVDPVGEIEVEADRQAARDKWLADEARQTRAGPGGPIA